MSLILDGTNGLSDVDGSAATPAIRGTDTNTGIFFPAADTIAFSEGGAESARFNSSGNLGIGTTSPTGKLHVYGSGEVQTLQRNSGSANNYTLFKTESGADQAYLGFSDGGVNDFAIYNVQNGYVRIATNNTERMRILSTGEVVVGKTNNDNSTPGIGLSLQGSNTAPLLKMVKTLSGGINSLVNWHNGTYVGGIDFNNTSTSFPTSSDIRLKKNIVNAGSATEKIDQIRIVSHGWKHDADELVEFGIIAQELYAVAPQAVTKGDDGEEIEKTWGVDYSKLVPMLLKAHQEQQVMITSLTARIAALENPPVESATNE
jgi:hypothetical protein